MTSFTIRQRIAKNYRQGRIFLAGDASHTHAPIGGQGMNTGIQDVFQLSWKLAFALKHKVNDVEGLLNSYEEERRSVGQALVNRTVSAVKSINTQLVDHILTVLNYVHSLIPDRLILPFLRTFSMIDINYQNTSLSVQSHATIFDFFRSPLDTASELLGFKLSSGSRLPHCNLATLSSPDKPQTIYNILQDQFPKIQLLFFSSDTQKERELIDYVKKYYDGLIFVRVICPTKAAAEQVHDITSDLVYFDYDGCASENFNGWDIIQVRPDCYIEYLGRPNEPLTNFFSFLEKVFVKNK